MLFVHAYCPTNVACEFTAMLAMPPMMRVPCRMGFSISHSNTSRRFASLVTVRLPAHYLAPECCQAARRRLERDRIYTHVAEKYVGQVNFYRGSTIFVSAAALKPSMTLCCCTALNFKSYFRFSIARPHTPSCPSSSHLLSTHL